MGDRDVRQAPGMLHQQISRRHFVVGAGLAGTSLFLAACGASQSSSSPTGSAAAPSASAAQPSGGQSAGGEIAIGYGFPFNSLDNKLGQADDQITVLRACREPLADLAVDSAVVPLLAKSFELTSPTVWTVALRDGVTFSDGTPVTVDDVSAAIDAYKNSPDSFVGKAFTEWPAVAKVDDSTLTLTTQATNLGLSRLMTNILVIPKSVQHAEDVVQPVPGSGPFMAESFDPGAQSATFVPNPNYVGPTPAQLSRVTARFIPDEATRYAALQAGEIDVVHSVAPEAAVRFENDPNLTVVRSTGTRLAHLFYNFRKPSDHPLANVKVREALTYAIDGDSILNELLLQAASPLSSVVPNTLDGAADVGSFSYDPEKAKSLLAEAGYGSGFDALIIWAAGEFFNASQVMEAIAEMLKAVGVNASLKEFASNDATIADYRSGKVDWDILGNGWGNQTGAALDNMVGIFAATQARVANNTTYHGYNFPEVTQLIEQSAAATDLATQADLLKQSQQAAWATWPTLYGFTQNNIVVHNKRVTGIEVKAINSFDLAQVTAS